MSPRLHLYDPWFCRFLLHSCDPNLVVDVTAMEVRAVRDIHAGDYLTLDYAATEDVIASQFACHCGAAHCRGWIAGRGEEANEVGRAFLEARKRSRAMSNDPRGLGADLAGLCNGAARC
jgi:hypothetical protein